MGDRESGKVVAHDHAEPAADPVAGQVSVASPLGRALLDTAVGGTAVLEIKGAERLIRVLDVLTA